jgi:hypothetical protein
MANYRIMKVVSLDRYNNLIQKEIEKNDNESNKVVSEEGLPRRPISNFPRPTPRYPSPPPPQPTRPNTPLPTPRSPSPNKPEELDQVVNKLSDGQSTVKAKAPLAKKAKTDSDSEEYADFPENLPIQMVCGDETSESVKNVLKDIPSEQHSLAKKLITFLCSTKIFRWTVKGEVSLKGKLYPKTNISELIAAVTSNTNRLQKLDIPGLDPFSRFLAFVQTPTELLGPAFRKIHGSVTRVSGSSDELDSRLDKPTGGSVGKGAEPCIRWISFEEWKNKQ